MTAPIAPRTAHEAREYLTAVERELADLPAEERAALIEDLELHLASLVEEGDDSPIVVRLGSPVAYAEELRAAAGLPARGSTAASPRRDDLRRLAARVGAHPLTGDVRRLWAELRPAWWVLRGYLLVALPCAWAHEWDFPVPTPLGSEALGVLLVPAAIAGSVALGRRQLRPPVARLVAGVGGVLALLALVVAVDATSAPTYDAGYAYAVSSDQAVGEYPLVSRYGPVTDVLPYAADGTPLDDVLLYDQDGRPLQVGFQEWWADGCSRVLRQPLATDGVPVPHAFPQTYVLDPSGGTGTGDAASCDATLDRPEVSLPELPAGDGTAATATSGARATTTPSSGAPSSTAPASSSAPASSAPASSGAPSSSAPSSGPAATTSADPTGAADD